jgi:hypothetical protein
MPPQFPYDAVIEAQYADDPDNPAWVIAYPLIAKWNIDLDHWIYDHLD